MVVCAYIIRSPVSPAGQSPHHPLKPNGALLLLTQPKHTLQKERRTSDHEHTHADTTTAIAAWHSVRDGDHIVTLLVPSPPLPSLEYCPLKSC